MIEVFSKIEQYKEESIKVLRDLISIPSVSTEHKGAYCADELVTIIDKQIGFDIQKIETPGYPIIYAEKDVGAPTTLVFYNHYDVQPPDPYKQWNSPPFELRRDANKLYGRGVSDNKGNLVARIFALKAYLSIFKKLNINIKFIIEGEEELGSPHLKNFIETYPNLVQGDFCIWESGHRHSEGAQQVWLGVKGILYLNLLVRNAKRDIHSSWGGVIENPAWTLIWALNSLKDKNQTILLEGFYDSVKPPTQDELNCLKTIPFEEATYCNDFGIESFMKTGEELKKSYYFAPTININGLNSGYQGPGAKTIIPNVAKAKIEFRIVPNQDPKDINEMFKRHLTKYNFKNIEVISSHGYPPARTPLSSKFLKIIEESAEQIYGKSLIVHPTKAGSGPMYLFINKMDCFALGCGHPSSNNHAPNENIFIDDFILNMKHLAAIFHTFATEIPPYYKK